MSCMLPSAACLWHAQARADNIITTRKERHAYESDVYKIFMQPLTFNPGNTITVKNQRHIIIQATDANLLVTYNTETHQIKAISQTLATKPLPRHGYQPLEAVTENEWATIRNIETNLRLEFTGTDCGDARTFIAFSEQVAKG